MITLFTAALLCAIVLNLLLGVVVLFTNFRRLPNRVFAVLSLFVALWLTCQFLGSTTRSHERLVFWIHQSCAVSAFIPLIFYVLRNAVVSTSGIGRVMWKPWPWTLAALAVAGLCQSHLFLVDAHLAASPAELAEPVYGKGLSIFVSYWIVAVGFLIWSFNRALKTAKGVSRVELQFMTLGSFLCLVPGVFIVLLIPFWTNSAQTARFAPVAVVVWHATIAYGIATRRIMGVAEFLTRVTTNLLLAGSLAVLYVCVFRLAHHLPLHLATDPHAVPHVAAAVAVALCLAPVKARLQRRTDRLFGKHRDSLANLLQEGNRLAHSIGTTSDLLTGFGRLLQETLSLDNLRIYLRYDARFELRYQQGRPLAAARLAAADPLIAVLRAAPEPLIRDELRRAGRTRAESDIAGCLAHADAEAVVALRSTNDMEGILLLGRRQGGQVFGRREADALTLLGDQLGIAVENARLYTRLQEAKHYNDVLLDNLVTGVVAADTNGRITLCNREALRLLHLNQTPAVIGVPAADVLPPPLADALLEGLRSQRGVRDCDAVLHDRSARECSVRYTTALFAGHDEAVTGVLLVLQDTTALHRLEDQVRRSDRLASLGTLAAGMAHEIKNPLVSLKTFVQLLPERYDDTEFRETFVPLLAGEVHRIDTIVTQLLNFARPSKPTLIPMALHETLDASLQLVAQQAKAKGLPITRRLAVPRDIILGDSRLLGQVFVNLLLNAIEATPREGSLTILTRLASRPTEAWRVGQEAEDWIETQIIDTGTGIAPADLPRIFDPFFTTKSNGTGLGLSVVHGIVWDHNGCIDASSTPGEGTVFRVAFPLLARSST